MALKAVVEDIASVPEGLRDEYEPVDGVGFRLKVEGADSLVDTSGLKSALQKEREKAAAADKWAKRFPGKTPEEIAELLEAKPHEGEGKPPLDTDKLRAKWRKEFEDEVAPVRKELDETKAKLRTFQLDEPIKDAALKAGVFPDQVAKVVKLTRETFDLNEKGEVVVLDKDGYPSSLTPEKYFADVFKKDMPMLYKAPESSGSGSRGAPGSGSPAGIRSRADLKTAADKAAFIEKHGLDAFKQLPAA